MWAVVAKTTWKQNFRLMTRYAFNTVSTLVTLYIVFALMFFGVKSLGGSALDLGNTLEGLFTGYVTWMLAIMGYSDLAWGITNESQTGTLEQLYLAPVGYRWIAAFTQSFQFAVNIVLLTAMVVLMSFSTGQSIHLDIVSMLPVGLCIYLQAAGLGFALAGLALIYKRIQSFFQIVQFAIVGFFMLSWDRFPWAKYLPLTMGQNVLQKVLIRGSRLWQIPGGELAVLGVVTVLYLAAGIGLFTLAEKKAKAGGLLGQY